MSGGKSLFVGGLDSDTQEQTLNNFFRQYGEIENISRIGDRGQCFITFRNEDSAKRARFEANGVLLNGKYIRCVLKFHKTTPPDANLYISNLLQEVTAQDLDKHFSQFGEVVSSKISYDNENVSKGYGFVQFDKVDNAEKAIEATDEQLLWGETVKVVKFIKREDRSQGNFKNVYVRGFPIGMKDFVVKTFEGYGKVISYIIKEDDRLGKPFGIFQFEDPDAAALVVNEINGKVDPEQGFVWYATKFVTKAQRIQDLQKEFKEKQERWKQTNLVIKNLPTTKDYDDKRISEIFQSFGELESVKCLKQENYNFDANRGLKLEETPIGLAFVCYKRPQDATRALKAICHLQLESKSLIGKRWLPKSERVAKMQAYLQSLQQIPPQSLVYPMPGMMGRGRGMPPPLPKPMGMPMLMQPGLPMGNAMPGLPQPRPLQRPPYQIAQPPVQQGFPLPQLKEDLNNLQMMSSEARKQIIGEAIYHTLHPKLQDKTGKITGMLLTMEWNNMYGALTNVNQFNLRVSEALATYEQHLSREQASA